jgi:hypothetical protein
MSGGADSEPDAKPVVYYLDDAGNYLKICKFYNFKHIFIFHAKSRWKVVRNS